MHDCEGFIQWKVEQMEFSQLLNLESATAIQSDVVE